MQIEIKQLECKRCGYKWLPRQEDVRSCPSCRSVLWDKEKIKKEVSTK